MDDVQTGGGAEIRVTDVRDDADVPGALFDPASLPAAADATPFKGFQPPTG